jgi:hypothetical protein
VAASGHQGTLARYPLERDGAIHHWLACGPITTPLRHLGKVITPTGSPFGAGGRWAISNAPDSLDLKARVYRRRAPQPRRPGRPPTLHATGPGGKRWTYAAAEEDHCIDFSLFNFTPTLMEGWLFASLVADTRLPVLAELLTVGPVRVWLNGRLVAHATRFGYVETHAVPFSFRLRPGPNNLVLQGEMIGWREARLALGLRLLGSPPVSIGLPLSDIDADQWQHTEGVLAHLQLRQFAFAHPPIRIHLDAGAPGALDVQAEIGVPSSSERRHAPTLESSVRVMVSPRESAEIPVSPEFLAGVPRLTDEERLPLTLRALDGTPFSLRRNLWVGLRDFRQAPSGEYKDRQRDAIEHLAEMPWQVLGAMAAVETGRTTRIESEAVDHACRFLEERRDCADFYAVSLLALLDRFADHPALAAADRRRMERAFRGFKFWIDEPGVDAMCYHTENHQILFHVAAYLAGQHWPDAVFTNSGLAGRRLMARARPRIEAWILRRLRSGFSEWDSNAYLALDAFALLALVEMAESVRLREMATALLHKLFFMLACQSWRGVHGSSHGRAYVESLKTARVENTSGLQRIAWGLGTLNLETRATGLLAMARRYRVPDVLQRIGADLPDRLLTRARSAGVYRPRFDLRRGVWEVNTLTYRTPDFMLSAALDHRPGEAGIQEHLWQATLGPEAVVFTTHPGNSQEHGHARPNFWAGSARLPRVAMTDTTVLCLYDLAAQRGLPFSHAHFPVETFDEHVVVGSWAFARVGDGYVAVWGDGDLTLTEGGRHAGQELRSRGPGRVWVCRMGRATTEGRFEAFCRRLRQAAPRTDERGIQWNAPEGRTLGLGWQGALLVEGRPEPQRGFPHYDNLYTRTPLGAKRMTISHQGERLVLDVAHGRVPPSPRQRDQ